MTSYERLVERLRKVQALHANTEWDGERAAAAEAIERLEARIAQERRPAVHEHKITLPDAWSRQLFVALLRREGLEPYRYRRQRHTTVMVRAPEIQFERLWIEFEAMHRELHCYLADVTQRVIAESVHADTSEPSVASRTLAQAAGPT